MEEMAPLIYTPTVGQACAEFGIRFRRPRGMYFTPEDRGQISASKCFSCSVFNFVVYYSNGRVLILFFCLVKK